VNTEKKSFWSSVPGVVTGVAGVLGAVVGLVGVLISLGVIGSSNGSSTVTTVPPSGTPGATNGAGGSISAAAKGSFTLDSDEVTLSLLKNEAVVKVMNKGTTSLSIDPPQVTGPQEDHFKVDADACTGITLGSGKSCSIKVTLTTAGAASATMVVKAEDVVASSSVMLKGTL